MKRKMKLKSIKKHGTQITYLIESENNDSNKYEDKLHGNKM